MRASRNRVRECLEVGRPAIGLWVWSGSPSIAELAAALEFDYVAIDMEHTPYDSYETVVDLFRAIESRGNSPWVRVPRNDPYVIGKVSELGAQGIIVPHIRNADEAHAAVAAVRYPPTGTMGVCPRTRVLDYDFGLGVKSEVLAVVEAMQKDVMVIGLIEDIEALGHLDEILETDIDGLYPGTVDLSFTLGKLETRYRLDHPEVLAARDLVIEKCRAHGKPAMCSVAQIRENGLSRAEAIRKWADNGIGIFQSALDLEIVLDWSRTLLGDIADVHAR